MGGQAYQHLREVYQVLRLVVNYFQPSLKLQGHVPHGERVRRVYDVAQTPLQRLLASGVLCEDRQRDLREQVRQIDPLALSEQLDALRSALFSRARSHTWPQPGLSPALCTSVPMPASEEEPERTGHQETLSRSKGIGHLALERTVSASIGGLLHGLGTIHPSGHPAREESRPTERIQGGQLEPLPMEPDLPKAAIPGADQHSLQAQPLPTPASGTLSNSTREREATHRALLTIEQAIAAYVQEMANCGRAPKTLQWHQTSLGALGRYLQRQFHLTDVCCLTTASLRAWLTELSTAPSARIGARRSVNTVVAYARSARAFCNWLLRQGYVSETLFPKGTMPKAQRGLPQPLAPEAFDCLLRACQLTGAQGGQNAGMTVRNRAILWLLLDTGLQVCELCRLRLADVDRTGGTVTVRGKGGHHRTFPLSAEGQRAVNAYLDQIRLTSAWEPAVPEARDRLLLTARRRPLTKKSLTLLFRRLSRRAGFTRMSICPSMLRDTYAIRFLQAGGELAALREQLGVADLVSVKRYQHVCEQRDQERESQEYSAGSLPTWPFRRGTHRRFQQRDQ